MNDVRKFDKKRWLVLLIFGLAGQIAWSVENMYFNLFVFDTVAQNLDDITLMVQLSGIVATVVTLISGTVSDKVGNRRKFISIGYIIWGITVIMFGYLSPELMGNIFGVDITRAVSITLVSVIVGDCVMTLFGSIANDACFNAWVTDNTESSFRGTVEGVLSILPLVAMLIVAGGFGILVSALGYSTVFLLLGIVISICGIVGIFIIEDSDSLVKNGELKDILYGFRPSVINNNRPLYITLIIVMILGISTQTFMPYLIIYMKTYLEFSVVEYSVVFGLAIILGAIINVVLGRISDKNDKSELLYIAVVIMALGLLAMYMAKDMGHTANLIFFGLSGFAMITGYIFTTALTGSIVRDYTPVLDTGKLQGVRMVFSVLIPMIVGPLIGNAINKARNIPLENAGADAMTTMYIPAPEIFLVSSIIALLMLVFIPILRKTIQKSK